MESKVAEKLDRYSRILKVIWYIVLILGLVVLAGALVLIVSKAMGKGSLPSDRLKLEFTAPGLGVRLGSSLLKEYFTVAFTMVMINIVAIWLLLVYTIHQFRAIFQAFLKDKTPFRDGNITRIRRIAYAFFIYSVSILGIQLILRMFFVPEVLVSGSQKVEVYAASSLPFWPIVCGIFALGIAEIFNYGLKLQQDNDSII